MKKCASGGAPDGGSFGALPTATILFALSKSSLPKPLSGVALGSATRPDSPNDGSRCRSGIVLPTMTWPVRSGDHSIENASLGVRICAPIPLVIKPKVIPPDVQTSVVGSKRTFQKAHAGAPEEVASISSDEPSG